MGMYDISVFYSKLHDGKILAILNNRFVDHHILSFCVCWNSIFGYGNFVIVISHRLCISPETDK